MHLMKDDADAAIRSIQGRQSFHQRHDRVIEAVQATVRPLFDSEEGLTRHLSGA